MSKLIHQHAELSKAIKLCMATTQNLEPLASEVLSEVVIPTINTYQQRLMVGVEDSVSDLLDTFKTTVSRHIFDAHSNWKVVDVSPQIFPKNCRFFHQKGNFSVVVIEQEPSVRSILMSRDLLGEQQNEDEGIAKVNLAIPYSVFIIQFCENQYSSFFTAWRSSPLNSLEDGLGVPILPNVSTNLNVCMGTDFEIKEGTVSEQANELINYFWQSQFSNDLSVAWWKKASVDSRIKSVAEWEENTLRDPSFVLQLELSYNFTLESLIEDLSKHGTEPDVQRSRASLSESVDRACDALFERIARYLKKTKFEQFHPKDVKENLSKLMIEAMEELNGLVLAIQNQIDTMKKELESSGQKEKKAFGNRWTAYCP